MTELETQKETPRAPVKPGDKPAVNVLEVLETHRRGNTLAELDNGLAEVIAGVRDTKRKGTLTVTLSAECRTPGNAKVIDVDIKVKATPPEPMREKSSYFATQANQLQREDPAQGTMGAILGDD